MDRRTVIAGLASLSLSGVLAHRVYTGRAGIDSINITLALVDNLTRFKWSSSAFNRVSWIAGLFMSVVFGNSLIYLGVTISLVFATVLNNSRIKAEKLSFHHGPGFMLLPLCYFAASQTGDPLLKIIMLLLSLSFLTPSSLPLLLISCYPIAIFGDMVVSLEFVAMTIYQINLCLDFFWPEDSLNEVIPISIV